MKSTTAFLFTAFLFITYSYAQELELELITSNLNNPVNIKHAGDDRLFIVEQGGVIKIIDASGALQETPFLDINDLVINSGNERGLLGLAFHPDYATNGYFFINYINNSGDTVISRFTTDSTNPEVADPDSESVIISYDQPYSNHNGGDLAFGSDGYLYISSGDGGSGGDPENRSQNKLSLLGKILRLNIDIPTETENYSIPADNPFIEDSNARHEIWAYGLRNPWKFSFDRLNGDQWIADVGQGTYEEINKVSTENAATGLNYGWRCYEGNEPYDTTGCADQSTFTFPIDGYNHFGDGEPKCSITGGYRYRGTQYPNLYGWYFFADFCSQEIGYLIYDETNDVWNKSFKQFSGQWSAFGEDVNGEIYVSDLAEGKIYKLTDTTLSSNDLLLSEITVYPNPTKNNFHINFGTNNNSDLLTDISIYDIHGKKVKSINRTGEIIQTVNTIELSSGIYILNINIENGKQSTHKLVIH
ncbi:PQQ-dependent sugar dehydrogenase [Winogradskyella thalassocola]|uniref:Por secretion system C-terminal sorting domain-containing protein n=1 Tax=Winogradskyella thalassocola TaxID=262004 RepID=A0A1G8IN82_9FLAO|nr:PQQ-dependent sugar dehydrogenase [Winogradskyella thalassocola]SDI20247.1 Por secretion system C-terminal sorting domain-containing protein [Winogradskyella thalassocola]